MLALEWTQSFTFEGGSIARMLETVMQRGGVVRKERDVDPYNGVVENRTQLFA
jgi:hypothetical protein